MTDKLQSMKEGLIYFFICWVFMTSTLVSPHCEQMPHCYFPWHVVKHEIYITLKL